MIIFPVEIWLMILKLTDKTTLWKLRVVSKRMYGLTGIAFKLQFSSIILKNDTLLYAAAQLPTRPSSLQFTMNLTAACFQSPVSYTFVPTHISKCGRLLLRTCAAMKPVPLVGFRGFGALLACVCVKLDPDHTQNASNGSDRVRCITDYYKNITAFRPAQSSTSSVSFPLTRSPISSDMGTVSHGLSEISMTSPSTPLNESTSPNVTISTSTQIESQSLAIALPYQSEFKRIAAFLQAGWSNLGTLIPASLLPAYSTLFRHVFSTYTSVFDRPNLNMDLSLQMALLSQTWRVIDVLAPPGGRDVRLCRDDRCCPSALCATVQCSSWDVQVDDLCDTLDELGLEESNIAGSTAVNTPMTAVLDETHVKTQASIPSNDGEDELTSTLSIESDSISNIASSPSTAATPQLQPVDFNPEESNPCTLSNYIHEHKLAPQLHMDLSISKAVYVSRRPLCKSTLGGLDLVHYMFDLTNNSILTLVCLAHNGQGEHDSVVDIMLDVTPKWIAEAPVQNGGGLDTDIARLFDRYRAGGKRSWTSGRDSINQHQAEELDMDAI
ncbi:hypothetical protein BATDEDRAFT_22709 [Batrachochytrium dendrobatidis JAM81]|uniref:Uncharacterized protein n=1 Tax=Batrachochytrium dendrobatidis (strain JAM81 / FGSC 10211) TaxID=684364 RepID=F4NXC1_BATDJ|nr:uncharacterized protein BATDEDRAFT_22709 [Batrachochytrium dendrobatidis JAM81]EGF82331.1 hypothetical protein BATDEDRAFT_22709 [Batrachochytrium dendrobatidis JAM81]|eukprot:XP_006676606.1 hypothetical protein BATDEDRAFT_22709 [Batrachochytrium dendrobatidis JAM81]